MELVKTQILMNVGQKGVVAKGAQVLATIRDDAGYKVAEVLPGERGLLVQVYIDQDFANPDSILVRYEEVAKAALGMQMSAPPEESTEEEVVGEPEESEETAEEEPEQKKKPKGKGKKSKK